MAITNTRCPKCSSYLHADPQYTAVGEFTGWVTMWCGDCKFETTTMDD